MIHTFNTLWGSAPVSVTAFPCVDCGLIIGNFCDGGISVAQGQCFAANRVPQDYPHNTAEVGMMRTPLCSYCETRFWSCRFCRGVSSCTPPNRQSHWSGVPLLLARSFDATQAAHVISAEFAIRAVAVNVRSVEAEAADLQRQDEDDRRIQLHLEEVDYERRLRSEQTSTSSSSNTQK